MTLTVHGMTCGGCENAVKRAVSTLPGVTNVTASHRDKQVTLDYDPALTTREQIVKQIESAGYQPA